MSDKRSKKYINLKVEGNRLYRQHLTNLKSLQESKRTIVLAKKEEKDEEQSVADQPSKPEQPKLLTKPKCDTQPVPITIAAREGSDSSHLSSSPTQKNLSLTNQLLAPTAIEQPAQRLLKLLQPIDIITNHYHLNTSAFSYLNDLNVNFFVVGIIGCQGVGKSTFLNLLCPMNKDVDVQQFYFKDKEGVFRTCPKDNSFSATPTTEGIQMYITGNRTILLDCSPVLCNPYMKKECVQSEIDDMKMLIFLMSVCHLLIVVQDELVNLNLLRLLHCAEMMKPNLDKEATEEYYPHVMFIKNMTDSRDFSLDAKNQMDVIYKKFFQLSKLKLYPGNMANGQEKSSVIAKSINYFAFPEIDIKRKYTGC